MSEFPAWLQGARAAPSVYNTQPWRFALRPNGDILVRWDPERVLPAADPMGRDLYLSLGAAIESARLRSAAAGQPLAFTLATDDEEGVVGVLTRVAEPDDRSDLRLAQALWERRTARTRHLRFPVPPVVLLALRRETVGWGCRLHIITERPDIRRLAWLTRIATAHSFRRVEVVEELFHWLRLDSEDPAYERDGLTAESLELWRVSRILMRWSSTHDPSFWPVRIAVQELYALQLLLIARQTASACLLTTASTDRSDMVNAGRLLLRLWLLGAEAGMNAHPLARVISDDATTARCLELFNAPGTIPAALFRLGFCPPVATSARLPLDELVEQPGRVSQTVATNRRPG
ncbi:MAG TPA: hypothetical protein VF221_08785 [Chloroflexota bacterium]